MSSHELVSKHASNRLLSPLLPGFVKDLAPSVDELARVSEIGEWARFSGLAHRLKGEAATYGYPDLALVAGELEAKTKHTGAPESTVDHLIADLRTLVQRAEAGLARLGLTESEP